jgi:two-component system, NtrC family, sensor histidine kinase HydH
VPRARTPNRAFRWLRAGLLLLPVCMGAALVGGALSNQQQTHEASDLLVRGQIDWFLRTLAQTLRAAETPPDASLLSETLEELRADGLEYVALLSSSGSVTVAAGTALSPPPVLDALGGQLQVTRSRARVQVTAKLPGWRNRRHAQHDQRFEARLLPPSIAFEFKPIVADRLRKDADRNFAFSVAAAAVLILIASGLWWQLRRRERQAETIEHERRLTQLGEMSAVLAHEMRNPLASLKGQAQLLVEQLPKESRESKKAHRIVAEALRLETLSQTLLDFVRSGNVERKAVDAVALLQQAVQAAAPGRVHVSTSGKVERQVTLDPLRMHQVLVNLLQNAAQACSDEQSIEALVHRTDRRLRIEIRDHGPGLPPGAEAKIFDAFETSKTHGTGLGLAIARRIVELHRGTLRAHNHPDGGAVFVLEIPG